MTLQQSNALNKGIKLKKVCILNYGSGNVKSVKNALDRIGVESYISNDVNALRSSSHIVLPGVGAFGSAMKRIQECLPLNEIENQVFNHEKPYLGICVGMQVLSERGYEHGLYKGLGWLSGCEVIENTKQIRQPHIGWNSVSIREKSPILFDIEDHSDFYFVHSYIMTCLDKSYTIGETDYGKKFPSIVRSRNIFGVQFHPEKSQENGLQLLRNFCSIE